MKMKKYKHKLNLLLALTVLLTIALACGGNQVEDANKLVAEANKSIDEAKELIATTEVKNTKLFSERINTVAEFTIYRNKSTNDAKTLIEDFGKISDKLTDASKKFGEAGKLKVADKFKEYLDLKSKEFAKRAEAVSNRKGNPQAFLDSTNPNDLPKIFDANNTKSKSILDEAEEIGKKADKIKDENKEIFKS